MGWEGHQELRVPKLTIRTIENRAIGALVICVVLIIGAVLTCSFRWGLMHDSPLMHYAAWCITDQGVPYRDLFDFNFPGTYLVHLAVLKILGPSDLAWRVFDLVWLSATAALMFTYCRYFGRLSAGLSVLAIVGFHLTSGPASMGQRDFLLVPFLLAASHGIALFQERRPRAAYLILSGLAVGAAVTVKPTSVCFAALIGLTAIVLAKRKRYPVIRAALIYTIAVATPIGVIALWLWNIGALLPFLKIIFDYTLPLYADLGRRAHWSVLMVAQRMSVLAPLFPLLLLALFRKGSDRSADFRRFVLLLGVVYGLFHFRVQGKGWPYHLYPLAGFWSALAFSSVDAIRTEGGRMVRIVLLGTLLLWTVQLGRKGAEHIDMGPWEPRQRQRVAWITEYLAPRLSETDTVQIFDATVGGAHVLFNLHCRQPSRFMSDFHFVAHDPEDRRVQALRRELMDALHANPPKFLLVFEHVWPTGGYERLEKFPELSAWIQERYRMEIEAMECRIYARIQSVGLR